MICFSNGELKQKNNRLIKIGDFMEIVEHEPQVEFIKSVKSFISKSQTVTIELSHRGGIPSFMPLSECIQEDSESSFYDESDDSYWFCTFFKWIEKFSLVLTNDSGEDFSFMVGTYINWHLIYLDYIPSHASASDEDSDFYDLDIRFQLPKLYGKCKTELFSSVTKNMAVLVGILKRIGLWIPFDKVDEFCSGKRNQLFFSKKRVKNNVPSITLSEAKKLLDEGALTQQEFEKIKRRILETI